MERDTMKLVLCNINTTGNSIIENYLDQEVLKEIPFSSKVSSKLPNSGKNVNYNLVMVKLLDIELDRPHEILLLENSIKKRLSAVPNLSVHPDNIVYSLAKLFEGKTQVDISKTNIQFDAIGVIDESEVNVMYTDGSFKKDTSEASFGLSILTEESESGLFDSFTGKKYAHRDLSESIPNGTNNIGELTGIRKASENFGDRPYQLIISDSEYGIKCFREWYYTWKDNNFRNYAKKPISNKELIVQTHDSLANSGKVVLFRWIKGHNEDEFNELCDELAKQALNIKG
jgi:ribonuclease HI